MKKLLFPILLLAMIATGCKQNEPEYKPKPEPEPEHTMPVAKFTTTVKQPMTVLLTNQSKYATSYKMYMGDTGLPISRFVEDYTYITKGVYQIKLIAINEYGSDTASVVVTIEEPKKCYCTGIKIYAVGRQNEYYYWELYKGNTKLLYTRHILLSSANLPYTYLFNERKELTDFKSMDASFSVRGLWSTTETGNGTQIIKQLFNPWDMPFTDETKMVENTTGDTKVTMLLEYE